MSQNRENGSGGEFWTAKEAASYFKISTSTLYRYCRKKSAPDQSKKPRTTLVSNPPPFRRTGRNVLRFSIKEFKAWCHQYDSPR